MRACGAWIRCCPLVVLDLDVHALSYIWDSRRRSEMQDAGAPVVRATWL